MKSLLRLIRSLWFVALLVLFDFGLATAASGMTASTIAYGGQTQPTIVYDVPSLLASGYDVAPALAANEKESQRAGTSNVFARFAKFHAAESGTLTFYRGTTYYDALETVQNGAFDAARLAQRQASASYSPGLYLTSQEATANYYADLAGGGLRGRGGGPAVLRITVPQDQFGALMQKYGIQLEIPVGRPPFPGQTETLIPPSAIDEFNAIMNVSHH